MRRVTGAKSLMLLSPARGARSRRWDRIGSFSFICDDVDDEFLEQVFLLAKSVDFVDFAAPVHLSVHRILNTNWFDRLIRKQGSGVSRMSRLPPYEHFEGSRMTFTLGRMSFIGMRNRII